MKNKKTLKNSIIIQLLLPCFFILLILVTANFHVNAEDEYSGTPATIAHDFLDIEKSFGASERHYQYINSLINKAKKIIAVKKDYSTEEAIKTMLIIHKLLKDEGFVFKQNFLLSKGLDSKVIDCDTYSALYISISEIVRLPVIPVYAPNHSFVRFNFNDGTYINWEPIEGKHFPDSLYIKQLNIHDNSISEGVYLKSLSRKEFLGVEYNNIGAYLLSIKKFKEAIPYFDLALEHYPKFSSAFHNRGSSYYAIKQTDNAFVDIMAANTLDPNQATTHNTLGDIYFDKKKYLKALDEYTESIKLDPRNYAPYYSIGLLLKIANKPEAEEWFKKSEEIKKKYK